MTDKKLQLVETVSMFRMRYVLETDDVEQGIAKIRDGELAEFSQCHLGETVISTREINSTEYLALFDADHEYLANWSAEEKYKFVNSEV